MNNPPEGELRYQPSLKEEQNGLYCFMDSGRQCGADCMAYTSRPEGPEYRDQQWANCLLLVNAHRGGKHLVVLAATTGELLKISKNESADRVRSKPAPPSPTGRG